MLGTQLHITSFDTISDQVFVGVRNSERSALIKKPWRGTGLWTSSWRAETQDSAWIEWCRDNHFGHPYDKNWFPLTPKNDAKLYVIDGLADLIDLLRDYKWIPSMLEKMNDDMKGFQRHINAMANDYGTRYFTGIDFERLSQEYDGLWLTEKGNAETHLSYPHDLNGWDCESVLWFHWCFTDVQRIAVPEPCLS